ncbi:G5 and 3D domain-containing protein [Aquibacillus salsiterrae]|uniref:Ubiquitin-like domain-containing protein n=1 Tax=Aquibacillus salsiterrae TaxID=2950439 RepID=A0A9X3WI92_9BACI|nr:G5 and 3D domain-containing protein [Aquibacillus salsiterrae]MDC3417944.1 ubiquitin-like domain-containing protein [Aquibacillus salsiterrae]
MNLISKLLSVIRNNMVKSVVSVAIVLVIVSVVTYEVTKAQVTVINNGEVTTLRTHAYTVGDVLADIGIEVEEFDKLSYSIKEPVKSDMEIKYEKAKPVVVAINGEEKQYYSTEKTVGEFLDEQGIEVSSYDEVSLDEGAALESNAEIKIKRGYQVTINDGGEEKDLWTTGGTVADLLKENDVTLSELDRITPKKTEKVDKDTDITITRVEKVTDVVEETVDYPTVTRSDNSIGKGVKKVLEPGEEGIVSKSYEVTLENGKEVSRELIKEEVKKESKKRIVAVGTKIKQLSASKPVSRGDDKVVKTMYMEATAYNWNCKTCSGSGLTRTGYNLKQNPNGVIAVDPSVIPLGTKVWVEGYGYAVARDTGGNIKGNRIDVHLPTLSEAARFGKKTVQVKILE